MATAKTDQVPSREELNSLVDTKKALFWQVHKLGRHYDVWTHRPLAGTFRLFEWDFMEVLSKTHWWVIPLYWTPVILSLILSGSYCTNTPAAATAHLLPSINGTIQSESLAARSLPSRSPFGLGTDFLCSIYPPTEQANTPESLIYILPLGMLIWTLVEYTLHRFVFHMAISGESPVLTTFHFMIHGLHHKFPMDPMRLVFPPVPGSAIAYLLHSLMCLLPVARNVARGLTGGMMIGYVVYDLMHYYLHHGKVVTTYLADLKDAHVAHHYRDHSKGFGISSKLWDVPFNTLDTSDFKRKST